MAKSERRILIVTSAEVDETMNVPIHLDYESVTMPRKVCPMYDSARSR